MAKGGARKKWEERAKKVKIKHYGLGLGGHCCRKKGAAKVTVHRNERKRNRKRGVF